LMIDKDEADLLKQEMDAYLLEPLQKKDCFKYWSEKAVQWPNLCKLFRFKINKIFKIFQN